MCTFIEWIAYIGLVKLCALLCTLDAVCNDQSENNCKLSVSWIFYYKQSNIQDHYFVKIISAEVKSVLIYSNKRSPDSANLHNAKLVKPKLNNF